MNQYRYPGLSSFKTEQAGIFFGRDRETRELFHLISVEKSVVLFSKSGTGKSSLIQAGVMPLLLETDIVSVPVRLGDETQTPEAQFSLQFDIAWRRFMGLPEHEAKDSSANETFWAQMQRCKFERDGRVCTPLIIFDQFEELFTLYPQPEQRARFVEELAALIMEKMPPAMRALLRGQLRAGDLDAAAVASAEKPAAVRFIISIRSDMLHFVDELSEQIPYILRSRYQLFGLDERQATEAITAPAMVTGVGFICAPFVYAHEALAEIITALSRRGVVESFQLQAICQALEEKIIQQGGVGEVTPGFYGGPAGIKNMLEEFYRRRIEELPEVDRLAARLVVEDALVNENKRRRSVDALDLLVRPGVSQKLLDALEQRRLVRKEPRLDSFYYEISHDTLLEPILALRKEREEAEAEARQLAEAEAERERLRAEAERQRVEREKITKARQRNVVFMVGALMLMGWAVWQTLLAGEQKKIAEERSMTADFAERKAYEKDSLAREAIRIVELRTKESLDEKEKAELATLEAHAQQRLAANSSARVVQNLLKEARTQVLHLQYDAAFDILKSAVDIGELKDSIGFAMMESAFFYAECDSIAKAKKIALTAAQLLGSSSIIFSKVNAARTKSGVNDVLKLMSPIRFLELETRYFPLDLVKVKGGKFKFGLGEDSTLDGVDAEVNDFNLSKTETSFWQFGLFWIAQGRSINDKFPDWGIDGNNPVIFVSWYDAVEYVNWLSVNRNMVPAYKIDSLQRDTATTLSNYYDVRWSVSLNPGANGYRLPTEVEWEFAARGGLGQQLFRYAGTDILEQAGWFIENSAIGPQQRTHPVQRLKPNTEWIFDMSGNVWEWCWNLYSDDYGTDNQTYPQEGLLRVLRGGSWRSYPGSCCVSSRDISSPVARDDFIGFRVASSPQ